MCDFHMYELLDQQRSMFGPEIYRGFPKIEARFALEAHPTFEEAVAYLLEDDGVDVAAAMDSVARDQ